VAVSRDFLVGKTRDTSLLMKRRVSIEGFVILDRGLDEREYLRKMLEEFWGMRYI
jgi:hypothetical protein